MFTKSSTRRAAALVLGGAAIGSAGGYAVSASATSPAPPASAKARSAGAAQRTRHSRGGKHGVGARLRRAVSITAVVPAGKGRFTTLSIERGTLISRSGTQLTLREGTRGSVYKTVTIALPAGALVRRSAQPASLAALSTGDRVSVIEGPHRTLVLARPAHSRSATAKQSAGAAR